MVYKYVVMNKNCTVVGVYDLYSDAYSNAQLFIDTGLYDKLLISHVIMEVK